MADPAAHPPVPAELDTCCRVLEALCDRSGPWPDHPRAAEVLRLAALLLRRRKRHGRHEARRRDEELLDAAGIHVPPAQPAAPTTPTTAVLCRPRSCYICKRPYTRLHAFYDCLCPECGDFNLDKRRQTADLRGRVALVTGARVKIGFHVGLKLLRAGATVVGVTRFPHDAARRYAAQSDAAAWADRLTLHGLDLRHLPAVERFAEALARRLPALDVFIHNAAQTVRRPPAFYRHLLAGERGDPTCLPPLARGMLRADLADRSNPPTRLCAPDGGPASRETEPAVPPAGPRWSWAELSQLPLLPEDDRADPEAFPPGVLDNDGQQVDRRPRNSWGLPLAEVTPVELLEVQAVNCLAPFLLLRGLEPALRAGPARDRYVVLVSAVEGQFGVPFKTGRHPHTNMAKAALNMLTRTAAGAYAAERILLTSVDTGWITNEAAAPGAERMRAQGFRLPLDAEDWAARVLDPVFTGVNRGARLHGVFLKDYRPEPW